MSDDPILARLERVIFDSNHRFFCATHGYDTSETTDHAWRAATEYPDGRRERARAAAEAIVRDFEVTVRARDGADCHSLKGGA